MATTYTIKSVFILSGTVIIGSTKEDAIDYDIDSSDEDGVQQYMFIATCAGIHINMPTGKHIMSSYDSQQHS